MLAKHKRQTISLPKWQAKSGFMTDKVEPAGGYCLLRHLAVIRNYISINSFSSMRI